MKLRIRGNSIRLRLGQSEVRNLAQAGLLEESTQFDPGGQQRLTYRLIRSADAARVSAGFESGTVSVYLPEALVLAWASSSAVGIEGSQAVGGGGSLRIQVEKDFECIDGPPDEPQDDAFPHPRSGAGCAVDDGSRGQAAGP